MAVAQVRSFRLASDRMGLSQPALSQSIAQLEAFLGVSLFIRNTRSVHLTAEGVTLWNTLSAMLPTLQNSIDNIRAGKNASPRLRLGFLASAAVKYLSEVLLKFRESFPHVDIVVRDDTAAGLYDAIHQGDLDLAVSSFLPNQHGDVNFELLVADPFMAVVRRDNPLATQKTVTWSELSAYDFIGANPDSGTRFATDSAMRTLEKPARIVMAFNHFLAVSGMVEARMGVSALPRMNCPQPDHPTLCAIELIEPVITRDVGILTSKLDGRISDYVLNFRNDLLCIAKGRDTSTFG